MPIVFWIAAGLAALPSALLVFHYPIYQREGRAAEARLAAESQVVETSLGRVEYAARGTGPAVIITHGIMGGHDQGLLMGEVLGPGFTLISPSRFGYLRSSMPSAAGPEAQADALAALLDALQIERAALLGASAGGPTALHFALRHPQRCAALVLASSTAQPLQKLDLPSRLLTWLVLRADYIYWLMIRYLPEVMIRYSGLTPELQARLTPAELAWARRMAQGVLPLKPKQAGVRNDIDQLANLAPLAIEQIQAPTMVTHAQDDQVVPTALGQEAARRIPGARLVLMERGGHFGAGNGPTFVLVAEFLRMHLG